MKILVATDMHYGLRNDSSVFYDYMKKSNDYMFSVMKTENINRALLLGDLFDRRKYVNYVTAYRCRKDFLEPLTFMAKTDILAGNHDIFHKDSNVVNSLDELIGNRYENLTLHKSPTDISIDGTSILLLPWISDIKNVQEKTWAEAISKSKSTVAMGHLAVNGFQMDSGVCSDGIEQNLFSGFEVVASGHFHHPMMINNIKYIGAMYENTWADYNDKRGFSIFDTQTRKFTFYQNPYTIFSKIRYNDDLKIPDLTQDFSMYENKYIKIVVESKTNTKNFDLFFDKLSEVKPFDITIEDNQASFDEEETSMILDQSQDTPTILSTYIDDLNLSLDSGRMKKLMLDLHKEAISLENVE